MGGEDFSHLLAEVPGSFFRVGNGAPDTPAHSPRFDFNDRTLKPAMLVMSALALRRLSS
jgi:metal-dependent amidase/aminoacylase/carboxypeptidase family protein